MAVFKHQDFLQQSSHSAFDAIAAPGKATTYGGIFRCLICGREIVLQTGAILPGAEHHTHALDNTPIKWQLLVAAN